MKNVRTLTEGAILLAIYVVLLLLTVYVPFMALLSTWFAAVPFILFATKNEWKTIIVFFISSLILSFIVGTVTALPMAFIFGSTGSVLGYLIQKQKPRMMIFLSGSFVFLVNLILIYILSILFLNVNIVAESVESMKTTLNMSADLLKNFGDPQEMEQMMEQYNKGLDLMITLIPTLFVLMSFAFVLIIQLVSVPIIKRFGVKVNQWTRFKDITLPKSLLWFLVITLLLSMFLNPEEGTYLYAALINLTYILQFLMMFQGFTFLFFYLDQKGISKPVKVFIAIIVFVVPIFLYIVAILGIIDLGFELRKKLVKE
nr:YybS family protein [Neobacillus sp. Marseille-Q6967]